MGKIGTFYKGVLSGMATMLNASGSAVVSLYDTGAFVVNRTRATIVPTEKTRLERSIKENTTRIIALQYEIGKESARFADPAEAHESLELRANIARVKDCEAEIEQIKQRLLEIAAAQEAAKAEKKAKKAKKKCGETSATDSACTVDQAVVSEPLPAVPPEEETPSTPVTPDN